MPKYMTLKDIILNIKENDLIIIYILKSFTFEFKLFIRET